MDGSSDPSYTDGFKRCIDETANVILNTAVPEEIKQHFITQLKILSLGHDTYSPLTPEYQRHDLNRTSLPSSALPGCVQLNPASLFPSASPLSSTTSPLHLNSSPSDRLSAFNAVENRTAIKQEVHSPQHSQSDNATPSSNNGIWRPW